MDIEQTLISLIGVSLIFTAISGAILNHKIIELQKQMAEVQQKIGNENYPKNCGPLATIHDRLHRVNN